MHFTGTLAKLLPTRLLASCAIIVLLERLRNALYVTRGSNAIAHGLLMWDVIRILWVMLYNIKPLSCVDVFVQRVDGFSGNIKDTPWVLCENDLIHLRKHWMSDTHRIRKTAYQIVSIHNATNVTNVFDASGQNRQMWWFLIWHDTCLPFFPK